MESVVGPVDTIIDVIMKAKLVLLAFPALERKL